MKKKPPPPSSDSVFRGRAAEPLYHKIRPKSLGDFIGQTHLTAEDGLIRAIIATGEPKSLLLWGPPGVGKTTLANIIATSLDMPFIRMSTAISGIADLKETIAKAKENLSVGLNTIVFIDEIHKYNKSQQDTLLPFVEDGTFFLIAATTENPSFEINSPLLSRMILLVLTPFSQDEMKAIMLRGLAKLDEGSGLTIGLADDALAVIVGYAISDARRGLIMLEVAYSIARSRKISTITAKEVSDVILRSTPYKMDKLGDDFYNVTSAFIKSLRGSDTEAALYWMLRMLAGGIDPLYIIRRMIIFTSEDVGNADPSMVASINALATGFDRIGLPEGEILLAQMVTLLATAEKSNASYTSLHKAREFVREHPAEPVPMNIVNAPTNLMKKLGYGKGYKYPHNYDGHFVRENYRPDSLKGVVFYEPTAVGKEKAIKERNELRWGTDKDPE